MIETLNGGRRWRVAVLGATGAVGQSFVRLLHNHPWFELAEVAASERSAGKSYREAAHWLEGELPTNVADLAVTMCDPSVVKSSIVFSALDSSVAGDVEAAFARDGRIVLSNAKNFRMTSNVPLVIPEVNGDHLALLSTQRTQQNWIGGIVTNANCAVTVIAMALAPLHERFNVRRVFVSTMQAVSGAGYPGVASLDILGNVIPFIGDEEPKIETELTKLLGKFGGDHIVPADIVTSAHANRVAVENGHTVCMSVDFERAPSVAEALETLRSWTGHPAVSGLPSAPTPPLIVHEANNRPQPRRDGPKGRGMAVSIGRVRPDNLFDLRMVAMADNIIRGASGGSILNAELMASTGTFSGLTQR